MFETYIKANNLPPENSFDAFRSLCFDGIPDEYRATSWKLLLQILPFDSRGEVWKQELSICRRNYYGFFDAYLREPTEEEQEYVNGIKPTNSQISSETVVNFELIEQIHQDIRRTFPDLAFFRKSIKQSPFSPIYCDSEDFKSILRKRNIIQKWLKRKSNDSQQELGVRIDFDDLNDYHWKALERILFIFARVNPAISYVQGMNALICPIYYVCANDPEETSRAHAEADAYSIFAKLMSELNDLFTKRMDDMSAFNSSASSEQDLYFQEYISEIPSLARSQGVGNTLDRLMELVEKQDSELFQVMNFKGIEPIFFAFRWISVMFSHEFLFPDVLRLWDSVFSEFYSVPCLENSNLFAKIFGHKEHSGIIDFLIQFSCAMLISVREDIIRGDFTEIMHILQKYPIDLEKVFKCIANMRARTSSAFFPTNDLMHKLKRNYKWGIFSQDSQKSNDRYSEGLNDMFEKEATQKGMYASGKNIPRGLYTNVNNEQSMNGSFNNIAISSKPKEPLEYQIRKLFIDSTEELETLN